MRDRIRIIPMKISGIGIVVALAGLITAAPDLGISEQARAAEPGSLEGSWSGGGTVRFPSGESERARCRANFRKRGGSSFAMTAVCATASVRVQQSAQVARTGPNRYAGDFHNAEYGVSGSIHITVHGSSLSASLNGGGSSAHLSLGR
jgi:hypothetical protein